MRKIYLLTGLLFLSGYLFSQCTPTKISSKAAWSVHYVDSEETTGEGADNGHAVHAIDDVVSTFWHTQWQDAKPEYPHEIQINLGAEYDVAGLSVLSRYNSAPGKPKDYEISLSLDGENWTDPQAIGAFQYPNVDASEQPSDDVLFGAVTAQYVKLRTLNSYGDYYYSVLSEIDIFEDLTCPATGQLNQSASFDPISKKYSDEPPFELEANTNSGLPITFEVISGPATVDGNMLTLTGDGGFVTVKASQSGNDEYYPWEAVQTFEVVNLSQIWPEITTRFTDDTDIKMRELMPYLLYIYADIAEPQALSVSSVEVIVDGESYQAVGEGNVFEYWWTPSQYGVNSVTVKATGSNGVVTTETYNLTVSDSISDVTAVTFDGDIIDMGTIGSQWFYGEYTLPQFGDAYDQIIASFNISCPDVPGGCDDWDRLGWIEFKGPDGNWMELFRYITPYGVACGEEIDVTDYASVLQGRVEFRMFIDTWGTGGWKLDLELDYRAGVPEYKFSKIEKLWHGTYSFGDPGNLQPVETAAVNYESGALASKIRLVTTGHGWGNNNTGNAAEFYHAFHDIRINGENTFEQDLWQICNPNPAGCQPQYGTWQHNRAGWCPGSMGKVFEYDMTPYISQGSMDLNYIFQESYVDNCHQNNPNCISGTTCPDCNDTYNPHYRVGGYLITYSNIPYTLSTDEVKIEREMTAVLYPNPSNGQFQIKLDEPWKRVRVTIVDVTGKTLKAFVFEDERDLNKNIFDISSFVTGVYFVKIMSEGKFTGMKVLKR